MCGKNPCSFLHHLLTMVISCLIYQRTANSTCNSMLGLPSSIQTINIFRVSKSKCVQTVRTISVPGMDQFIPSVLRIILFAMNNKESAHIYSLLLSIELH